jgi:hypothetical protein
VPGGAAGGRSRTGFGKLGRGSFDKLGTGSFVRREVMGQELGFAER